MVRTARRLLHSMLDRYQPKKKTYWHLGQLASAVHKAGAKSSLHGTADQRQGLNTYLADINEQATEQMLLLTEQMAEREGVTEQPKAQDQMQWVQRMNNIRDRATEIVNHDPIYI